MHLICTLGFTHIRCHHLCVPVSSWARGWARCLFSIPDTTEQSSSICSGDSGQPSTCVSSFCFSEVSNGLPASHAVFPGQETQRDSRQPLEEGPGSPSGWKGMVQAAPMWMASSPTRKGDRESKPTQRPLFPLALPLCFLANYTQQKKNQSTS